jgi:hypothetical protein
VREFLEGGRPEFDWAFAELTKVVLEGLKDTRVPTRSDYRFTADEELAKRIGLDPSLVIKATESLFNGSTLTEERDRRVRHMGGQYSMQERQAHRGHITRELSLTVVEELERSGALAAGPVGSDELIKGVDG